MIERLVAALILIGVALCGYFALIHWNDDPHPLMVDAGVLDLGPGQAPLALPHQDMLFVPCPITPRNVPTIQKREA